MQTPHLDLSPDLAGGAGQHGGQIVVAHVGSANLSTGVCGWRAYEQLLGVCGWRAFEQLLASRRLPAKSQKSSDVEGGRGEDKARPLSVR